MAQRVITVIPARMSSTRLPGKPLAEIAGLPMIVQVWKRALEADVGPVLVTAPDREVLEEVRARGGRTVLTDEDCPSGSDRIAAALARFDPDRAYGTVINLQGDLPTMDPASIRASLEPLAEPAVDIATLAVAVDDAEEAADPNVVKVIGDFAAGARIVRARDFVRVLPDGHSGPHHHHVGLYTYRRSALENFVRCPVSVREREHRLEQLRALDAGMRIDAVCVDTVPLGVDTPADLERARAILG